MFTITTSLCFYVNKFFMRDIVCVIRASDISRGRGPAKSHEIPQKTRNTAKSARNISKYISAKHI